MCGTHVAATLTVAASLCTGQMGIMNSLCSNGDRAQNHREKWQISGLHDEISRETTNGRNTWQNVVAIVVPRLIRGRWRGRAVSFGLNLRQWLLGGNSTCLLINHGGEHALSGHISDSGENKDSGQSPAENHAGRSPCSPACYNSNPASSVAMIWENSD